MNVREFIKPTKQKLYSFIILVIGLIIIPAIIEFFLTVFAARTLGPEKYSDFLVLKNANIPFIVAIYVIYFLWFYLVTSIIIAINKDS